MAAGGANRATRSHLRNSMHDDRRDAHAFPPRPRLLICTVSKGGNNLSSFATFGRNVSACSTDGLSRGRPIAHLSVERTVLT